MENENKKNQKKLKCLIITIILIILIVLLIIVYLYFNQNQSKPQEPEVQHSSYLSDGIRGTEIKTTLDLEGIFYNDEGLLQTPFNLINNTKAIINNGKIYYTYSPSYCSLLEDNQNSDSEITYIKSKNSLCKKYDKNNNKGYEELLYRYLIVSDVDGTNQKQINKFSGLNPITFNYIDDKIALYYPEIHSSTYKLDFQTNESKLLQKNAVAAPAPISNSKNLILVTNEKTNYKLDYYDYKTFKTTSETILYPLSTSNIHMRADKYDSNSFYTISDYVYDKALEKNYFGIYHNGKLFYKTNAFKTFIDYFATKKYLYIFGQDENNNLKVVKVNKLTIKEENTELDLSLLQSKTFKYIATGYDNKIYLYDENQSIYTFSENEKTINKLTEINNFINGSNYKQYIHLYTIYDEDNNTKNLTVYDTKNNKTLIFKAVMYYYFDNSKLYVVHKDGSKLKLFYYDM